jgi:hypothetical protein
VKRDGSWDDDLLTLIGVYGVMLVDWEDSRPMAGNRGVKGVIDAWERPARTSPFSFFFIVNA